MGSIGSCSVRAELHLAVLLSVSLHFQHFRPLLEEVVAAVSHPRICRAGFCSVLECCRREQDACWEKRGWSWVRWLWDGGSFSVWAADDAGVGRPAAGGRTRRCGGVSRSLQLPGEHGGLPRPRDPLRTQKHPQRDREAVSNHTLTTCVVIFLYTCEDQIITDG